MKEKQIFHFMVDFTLPNSLNEDFISKIPSQKKVVNRFLAEGSLINYAVSLETQKLWAMFRAKSEVDVLELVSQLPLTKYMEVRISELSMFATGSIVPRPIFSFN